jgi:hypothetical protein
MSDCCHCEHELTVTRLDCPACGVRYEGEFGQSRLARLPGEMHSLAEQVLLAGGNLKEVATWQGVSYPTLRKRIDGLIAALEQLRARDEELMDHLLGEVEAGRVTPEYAARRISEMSHGD